MKQINQYISYECHHKCTTCLGPDGRCDDCKDSGNRSASPDCKCNTHKYDVYGGDGTCQECSIKCKECSQSATTCTECQGQYRTHSIPNCECQDGYYDTGVIDCTPCNYKCHTCTGTPTTCTSCRDPTKRKLPNCDCIDGFYDDGTGSCEKCHHKCKTCTSSATNCLTCHGENRATTPPCACNPGYFDDGTINCVKCKFPCSTCENGYQCQTCVSSSSVARITNKCSCPAEYYDDLINDNCQACQFPCVKCLSASECITCVVSSTGVRSGAKCKCPESFYDDGTSNNCQSCQYPCVNCSSPTQCITCVSSTTIPRIPLTCKCPEGYFDNGSSHNCLKCVNFCSRCTDGEGVCEQCVSQTRHGTNCICKEGYEEPPAEIQAKSPHCQKIKCLSPICGVCKADQTCLEIAYEVSGFIENGTPILCKPECKSCNTADICIDCLNSENREPAPSCKCHTGYTQISGSCQLEIIIIEKNNTTTTPELPLQEEDNDSTTLILIIIITAIIVVGGLSTALFLYLRQKNDEFEIKIIQDNKNQTPGLKSERDSFCDSKVVEVEKHATEPVLNSPQISQKKSSGDHLDQLQDLENIEVVPHQKEENLNDIKSVDQSSARFNEPLQSNFTSQQYQSPQKQTRFSLQKRDNQPSDSLTPLQSQTLGQSIQKSPLKSPIQVQKQQRKSQLPEPPKKYSLQPSEQSLQSIPAEQPSRQETLETPRDKTIDLSQPTSTKKLNTNTELPSSTLQNIEEQLSQNQENINNVTPSIKDIENFSEEDEEEDQQIATERTQKTQNQEELQEDPETYINEQQEYQSQQQQKQQPQLKQRSLQSTLLSEIGRVQGGDQQEVQKKEYLKQKMRPSQLARSSLRPQVKEESVQEEQDNEYDPYHTEFMKKYKETPKVNMAKSTGKLKSKVKLVQNLYQAVDHKNTDLKEYRNKLDKL